KSYYQDGGEGRLRVHGYREDAVCAVFCPVRRDQDQDAVCQRDLDPSHAGPCAVGARGGPRGQMLGGRLDFGVAIGYRPWDLQAAGIARRDRVPKFEESIEIIKLMWTHDKVSFHGKYFNFDDLPVNIKPYQKPHPPIVVSCPYQKLFYRSNHEATRHEAR